MSTAPEAAIIHSKVVPGLPISEHTPEPHKKSRGKMSSAIAPGAASAQSTIMASLMTSDPTPEPPKRPSKAPNAMQQQRLKTPQDIRKNHPVSGPSSGDSIVQETPHTDVTAGEFHPNAFEDDTSSLATSDNENRMEIDSPIPPDQYHLDKYREATPYLFQLEDPSSLQNISKINKKIATHNVKNKKQE